MSRRFRLALFAAGFAAFFELMVYGVTGLTHYGASHGS